MWRVTVWTLAAFVAGMIAWALYLPAHAAIPPQHQSAFACDRDTPVPAIRIGRDGGMEISFYDRNRCVVWRRWEPSVRPR